MKIICCVKLSCLFGALQCGTALLTFLLGLMTLAHLKSTGQSFYRMSLNLVLSVTSPKLGLGDAALV